MIAYVFINKENPRRIKMIPALSYGEACKKLEERLDSENKRGTPDDYYYGYRI